MIGSGADLTFMQFVENLTIPVLFMMLTLEWFSRRYYRADLAATPVVDVDVTAPPIHSPTAPLGLVITGGVFIGSSPTP